MCLSTVYELRDGEKALLCRNIAEIGEVNGQIVMTDIMGISTRVFGEIERIDLMENFIIINRYDFDKTDTHTHVDENGVEHTHTHAHSHDHEHTHQHEHSPEVKKKQLNRISRAIGHCQRVKSMIASDVDCSDTLIQLAAVTSALRNLGKEIINEHMSHCIRHAIEDGDTAAVEEFQEAVKKFI